MPYLTSKLVYSVKCLVVKDFSALKAGPILNTLSKSLLFPSVYEAVGIEKDMLSYQNILLQILPDLPSLAAQ